MRTEDQSACDEALSHQRADATVTVAERTTKRRMNLGSVTDPVIELRRDVDGLTCRVELLESTSSVSSASSVVVPCQTNGNGRDIAYWYPVLLGEQLATGDVVFLDENQMLSKARPHRACVCGVVVDPSMPWAHIGRPAIEFDASYRPVCVKGQVRGAVAVAVAIARCCPVVPLPVPPTTAD